MTKERVRKITLNPEMVRRLREMSKSPTPDLAGDRLRGVDQIAEFLGESPRRVSYLIERGLIPHGREGSSIIASKAKLLEYHRKLTGGE